MSFLNASRPIFLVFWAIVFVSLFLLGITLVHITEPGHGAHHVLSFFNRILNSNQGFFGFLIGIGGSMLISYVMFGAWATLSVLLFLGLSRFDRDLAKHLPIPVYEGAEWDADITGSQVYRLIFKVLIFTIISCAISMLLLSLL